MICSSSTYKVYHHQVADLGFSNSAVMETKGIFWLLLQEVPSNWNPLSFLAWLMPVFLSFSLLNAKKFNFIVIMFNSSYSLSP